MREVRAIPGGWSLGFCVDDGKIYFIKLATPGLKKAWNRIREKWGELLVADRVFDFKNNTIFYPPVLEEDEASKILKFRMIVEKIGDFNVARGGILI